MGEATNRKNSVETFLKELRKSIPSLKYQFRAGFDDIKLMLKKQEKNDKQFLKEVPLTDFHEAIFKPFEYVTPPSAEEALALQQPIQIPENTGYGDTNIDETDDDSEEEGEAGEEASAINKETAVQVNTESEDVVEAEV